MNDARLPDSWRLASLAELGEVNRGRSRYRRQYADHLYGGPYPFIQTGDIRTSGGGGVAQTSLWMSGSTG